MELTDKVALVTGSPRRVGRAISLALARSGLHVALHYNRSSAEADALAAQIAATGRRTLAVGADLADPAAIAAMFAQVARDFGRLDVLVNNASLFRPTAWEQFTPADFQQLMNVNALAPALCIQQAIPLMRAAGGGAIVNITDIGAEKAWGGYGAYAASKSALIALTKSAARALAKDKIRVNGVAPGVALWPDDRDKDEAYKQSVLKQVPLGRPGTPDDIANAVVFLAGQDYITGQNLRVDGGWMM